MLQLILAAALVQAGAPVEITVEGVLREAPGADAPRFRWTIVEKGEKAVVVRVETRQTGQGLQDRTWKGSCPRKELVALVDALERMKAFDLSDAICKCPHPGYALRLREGKRVKSLSAYWNRIPPDEPASKPYHEVYDLLKGFVEKHSPEEEKAPAGK